MHEPIHHRALRVLHFTGGGQESHDNSVCKRERDTEQSVQNIVVSGPYTTQPRNQVRS